MNSNRDYLRELADLLDRFRHLVEIENGAIKRRETAVLRGIATDKMETGNELEILWREFRPRLENADQADRDKFAELADMAARLRPLVAHNMALLNAAQVTTANRIEAGISAWRRSQREKTGGYAEDGRAEPGKGSGSIQQARLI